VPGARRRLAPLGDFTDRVGVVRAGLPCAGTPVVVGAMDAWAGMFGLGVIHDGEAMYQSGTSEIPGIVSATVVPTPGVIVFPAYQAITLHAAPTQAGGSALTWMGNLVNRGPDELLRLAGEATASAATPLFLPHLEGERAPLWDNRSRGVFARLDAATGPGDLALAVMEGVAFSVKLAFAALETSAGGVVETVKIGGGGARSDLWCQIRADVLGKTLQRAAVADAGTLGAVILAGLGVGEMASLEDAIRRLVRFDRAFEPDTARRGYYDDRYGKYLALYADLRGFNERFA
jgi:xylulokinase